MQGSILVPLDGSARAEAVLPLAVTLANHFDVPILLLRVLPRPSATVQISDERVITIDEQLAALESHATGYLENVVGRVTRLGVTTHYALPTGPPAETIASWAHEQQATYVLLGTHGHSGLTRWTLGSVADRVLRLTDRPLIIQRPPDSAALWPAKLPEIRRILVPLDGSALAEEVLPHAAALADRMGAALLLLRAIPTVAPVALGVEGIGLASGWYDSVSEQARYYLEEMAAPLRERGIAVQGLVGSMPAAETILAAAETHEVDLVAMSSHARSALGRALLGSVTDRVIRAGEVPVLVTRAAGDR